MDKEQVSTNRPHYLDWNGTQTRRDLSDRELLVRFLTSRDEAAFTGLVQRHAGTVWGVCQRVLHQQQDAEDAFQAVFLTLARKAEAIRKAEAVGSWLYGVAYRIALKARQATIRRRDEEQQMTEARSAQPAWGEAAARELRGLLDEAVQNLPEKYRSPFVLCCLEGLSKAEAAQELGWKVGTVSGRLAQARKLLQGRLARRGITLSAGLTAIALSGNTAGAAPVLIDAMTKAVLAPLAGKATATALSPSAIALAEGFMKSMVVNQAKAVLALVLALTTLVAGVPLAASHLGLPTREGKAPEGPGDLSEPELFLPRAFPLVRPIDEQVLTLAFSPDGKRVVTGGGRPGRPGQIKVWEVATARELLTIKGIPGVRTVAFAPGGDILANGDLTGTIRLRDAATGEERAKVNAHAIGVNCVAFSPDGTALVSAGLDGKVKVWDVKGLRERKVFLGHTDMVFSAAFFRHGKAFVTCGKDKTARIWDIDSGKEKFILQGHREGIEAVAVSPDDRTVATASWDHTVKLWDAETGKETAELGVEGDNTPVFAVAFCPTQGNLLAAALGDGAIRLWDVRTRKVVKKLEKHATVIWALSFSPDGKTLASGSSDTTAKPWDMAAGLEKATLKTGSPQPSPILALAYAPAGDMVAMATADRTVQVRDAETGDLRLLLVGHADVVTCLAYSPSARALATGSADKTIKLWDLTTGKEIRTLEGHTAGVNALAFTPDGKKLASGGDDGGIKLWDPDLGKELATFKAHEAAVRALAFAPDGGRLASGGADRTIKLWDPLQEKKPLSLEGHEGPVRALAFAGAGTLASASEDGTVKLWDPIQGKERATLKGHTGEVWALAASPAGGTLVSGGRDSTVIVWDPATGQARQTLKGHLVAVTALAYHPRGGRIISGSLDTTVLRWLNAPPISPALTLESNPDDARFALFSPDGKRLASGGGGGTVTLWSRSLAPARVPFADRVGIYSDVAVSPDGQTVALASSMRVQLCDLVSGEVLRNLAMGEDTKAVAFSPDGKYLAAGTGMWNQRDAPSEVRVFDAATGKELLNLPGHGGYVNRVGFSPDGKTLATACEDGIVRLWEVPSGKLRASLSGHRGPVAALAFLPDGTLATTGLDATIRFWDVDAFRETKVWKTGNRMRALAVSPDGTLLAGGEGPWASKGPSLLRVWEVGTGKVRFTLQGHDCRILGVAFTRDGRGLVGAGSKAGAHGEIDLWDLSTGQLWATHRVALNIMEWNVAVSMDGKRVISTSPAGFYLWDLDFVHKERAWVAHTGDVTCGLFMSSGATLATGGQDGAIHLWDVAGGELRHTFLGHKGAVHCLALLPDGKTLLSGGEDATVKLWDLTNSSEKATLRGHAQGVYSLAVSPDGKTVAAGGADKQGPGELILWDPETGQKRRTCSGIEKAVWSVAYSPDGSLLAAGIATGVIQVLDAKTGEVRAFLPAPSVRPLAFSPDGRLLAAGHGENANDESGTSLVSLWDTGTWKKRAVLQHHNQRLHGLAFSPDGGTLAAASRNGTVQLTSVPGFRGQRPIAFARQEKIPLGDVEEKAQQAGRATGGPAAPAAPVEGPTAETPQASPRKSEWRVWPVLLLVGTLGLGVWLALRRGRHAGKATVTTPARYSPAQPAVDSSPVSFPCPACGKKLKARTALAGKRVKCPQCAQGVLVPGPKAQGST